MAPKRRLPLDRFFFGRSEPLEEIASLLLQPSVRVVLVSGPSGVGKTTLVEKAINNNSIIKGSAKFDAQTLPLEAIQTCLGQIVENVLLHRKECLHQEMDQNHQELLQSIIPSTKRLFVDAEEIDKDNNAGNEAHGVADIGVSSASCKDMLLQLRLAIVDFLRVLCQKVGGRIALVLDDLQWCDQDSFGLLTAILGDPQCHQIVVCGTFRDESDALRAFRNGLNDAMTRSMELKNLTPKEVQEMLTELLDDDNTLELSRLIHQRTAGNIYFIRQLLESLEQQDLIAYDWISGKFKYDIQRLQESTEVSENVLQVVVSKVRRLDPNVQTLLQLCACLGSRIHAETIEICLPAYPEITDYIPLLELACTENLLDDLGSGWFKFSHDKVVESVRYLLPTDRQELHWRLGKLLWQAVKSGKKKQAKLLFACADHINLGAKLCVKDEERLGVAKLNLSAAVAAATLSAFHPACWYCKAGINVLGEENPKPTGIVLDLYVRYAEMLYCVGQTSTAKEYCDKVFASASVNHKVPCYITMMQILNAEAHNKRVIEFGLEALKELGEPFPKKPTKLEAFLDYNHISKLLKKTSDQDVLSLPVLKDARKAACIEIMEFMVLAVVHQEMENMHTLVLGRMLRLTLRDGLSKCSPHAFVLAGVDVIARNDEIDMGYRLGKLANDLVDRLQSKTVEAKVCMWTSVFTQWWMEPLTQCLDTCIRGYNSGMRFGDLHYGFHCITAYCVAYFYSGLPLGPFLDDLEKYCQQMIDYGQFMVLFCTIPYWQCTLNLCGKQPSGPLDMSKGYAIDKEKVAGNDEKVGEQACWSFLMQLCFYLGDVEQAAELSHRLQGLKLGVTRAEAFYPTRVFFFALSAIERFRSTGKRKFKIEAKKHVDQISKWIASGAINMVHKGMILRAEMESLESKDWDATRLLYDKAIATAKRSGFIQDAALASQLAASFCEKKNPELSAEHVKKAWEQWTTWGAVAVAEYLQQRYPRVFESSSLSKSDLLGELPSSKGHRSRRRFDTSIAKQHDELDYH